MNKEIIKSELGSFIKSLGISFDEIIVNEDAENGRQTYIIKTNESGLLIGTQGTVFSAFSHIFKKIIAKKLNIEERDTTKISLDVNDYKEKNKGNIEQKARIIAERAISFKCDMEMDPMSSYERMCIHSYLKDFKNIKTESKGEGRDRRLVIKYIPDVGDETL